MKAEVKIKEKNIITNDEKAKISKEKLNLFQLCDDINISINELEKLGFIVDFKVMKAPNDETIINAVLRKKE